MAIIVWKYAFRFSPAERHAPKYSTLLPYLRGQNLDNIFMDAENGEKMQTIIFINKLGK